MDFLIQIISSPITNVVLTLLIVFQWFWQRAKEQSIKNSIFSVRRILSRMMDPDNGTSSQKAHDLIDNLDAILATLNARPPFTERINEVSDYIRKKIRFESKEEIELLSNEVKKNVMEK